MYIFVFKYLNTSFAAIPRERVRKIFRRLFTEPLLPLREAQDSFFDFLRFHSSLWNVKAGCFFFFSFFFSSFFLSPFSPLLPFPSFFKTRFHRATIFPRVISYCHGSSCRTTTKRWTERNGEAPFSVRTKRKGEEKEKEREKSSEKERIGEVCVLEWQDEVSSTYRRLLLRSYAIVHCSTNNKVD